eukprot:2890527-Amphidinium_carterae.2
MDPDDDIHSQLAEAKKLSVQPNLKQWKQQTVRGDVKTVLQVERSYVALSLLELKKRLGAKSIAKTTLDSMASVKAMDETGRAEVLYLFKDGSMPYRRVNILTEEALEWSTEELGPASQAWTQHSESVWKYKTAKKLGNAGVSKVLHNSSLQSLDDFIGSQSKPEHGEGDEGDELDEEEEEEPGEL